jgi:hypothetical protein
VENNPGNLIDPMGYGSLARWAWTGDWNASDDTYDAALDFAAQHIGEESKKGLAAGIDGFIPFADPFRGVYADACGKIAPEYETSQSFGGLSRDALLMAVGMPSELKPFTQTGATEGTSIASKAARQLFGSMKFPIHLPAPTYMNVGLTSRHIGTVVGRLVPPGPVNGNETTHFLSFCCIRRLTAEIVGGRTG